MTQSITATADRKSLLAALAANPADSDTRRVYADWLEENGANWRIVRAQRTAADQTTIEGSRCVTVARDGANMARTGPSHTVPIYTTAIYTATRRADGVLTWRRTGSVGGHNTAGREVSGPMVLRAHAYADEKGLPYLTGVRHGEICN